jgi:hypothetical protein
VYVAAAFIEGTTWGGGDPIICIKKLCKTACPMAYDKLKMILKGKFEGTKLFKDNTKNGT